MIPAPGIVVKIEAKRRLQRKARSFLELILCFGGIRGAQEFDKGGKSVDLVELYCIFDRLRREGIFFTKLFFPWQKQKL